MKNLAVAFMGALVLAGCGSVRYPTTYVLNFPPPVPQAAPSNGALGPVAIREFRCPEYLCEGRIVYRSSPEEVGFYEYHRWAMNPRQAITQYVEEGLRAQSLFKSVSVHERGSEAAYVLSGNIERLEEVDQGRDVTRRLHDLGATAGYSNEICRLEPHGIGNGPGGEAGHPRCRQQPLGRRSDCSRSLA